MPGMLAEVPPPHELAPHLIARMSFSGCLVAAAQHSGKDDQEIAREIHISQGYMSRFMRGIAQQWAKRLIAYMRATNSLAPLQKMAEEMGCDLKPRSAQEAHIARLEAQLEEAKRRRAA